MFGRNRDQKHKERALVAGKMDYSIVLVIVLLLCFGLLILYSTSYYTAELKEGDGAYYFSRQLLFSGIGLLIMIIASFFNYRWICNVWSIPLCILAVILMCLVNFSPLGKELNGSKRWLNLGFVSFQPTEFVKIATIIFSAVIICRKKIKEKSPAMKYLPFVILAIAPALVAMKNLSSFIIIFGTAFLMFFMAAKKEHRKWYFLAIMAVVALIAVAYFFGDTLVDIGILKKYQLSRIDVWKDPGAYASTGGYQVLQGLYAIGSGGFFGKGLGNSVQKLGYVPEAQNDMVFSIICEELGLFGAICLMGLYILLIYKIVKIAVNSRDRIGKIIASGIGIHISLQVVLNIAVVTNSIPNTGVSLPFISYGGSSVIFLLAEMGVLLNIARQGNSAAMEERLKKQTEEHEETLSVN